MPHKPTTPEERRAAKAAKSQANRVAHVKTKARQAPTGHDKVIVACNAALAASKGLTEAAQLDLARAIAVAADQADIPTNRKDPR